MRALLSIAPRQPTQCLKHIPIPLTQIDAARFSERFDRGESVRCGCKDGTIMIHLRSSCRIGRLWEATVDANAKAIWSAVVDQAPRTEVEAANAFWGAVAQWRNFNYDFQSGYLFNLGAHNGGFFWFHHVSNPIPFLLISSSAQTIRRHGKFLSGGRILGIWEFVSFGKQQAP